MSSSKLLSNKTFYSLIITLFFTSFCFTQEFVYEHFGVDQGLPSSQVYDVYQTKDGYIWFATDKGLSRYNGYEFENFDTTNGLSGNVVLRFYPQNNGEVWCYSYHNQSLFFFHEHFKGFTPYKYNHTLTKNFQKGSIVKSVYKDSINNVHIGGSHINGELLIDSVGISKTKHASKDYFLPISVSKKSIVLTRAGKTSTNPFFYTTYNTKQNKTSFTASSYRNDRIMADWLIPNRVSVFMNDSIVKIIKSNTKNISIRNRYSPIGIKMIDNAHFFIGYEFGGGNILNKDGKVLKSFLKGKSLTSLLIDHEGGYWFTTLNSGVYYVKNPNITHYEFADQNSNHINSLTKTINNELWIGYNNGNIIKLLKNRLSKEINNPKGNVRAFVESDSLSNITYYFNYKGLSSNKSKKTLLTNYILKISEPIDSSIFISIIRSFHIIKNNKLTASYYNLPFRVHDITVWKNDTILATPKGLFKFRKDSVIPLNKQSPLYNFRSDDIDLSPNRNTLYTATQNAGLIINDGHRIYNITTKDGLYSDIINEISVENDSTLWLCTNKGLNKIIFNEKNYQISGINRDHGLLSNEIEDIEVINDTVWVGTKQGLCSFPKKQMISLKNENDYFKLKTVYINNDIKQTIENNTELSYKENEIDFIVEGISYANRNNLHYHYRLNKNLSWTTTKERRIHFSSLSPNKYTFEAKMCADNKNCSEKTITFSFHITPPFWKTTWFKIICLISICFLFYIFFKIRVLTYNKDIVRELLRLLMKYLKRKEEVYFSFKENGNNVRIKSKDILYIKSSGNYIDIFTLSKKHTVRMNIGKFLSNIPDKFEFVRVHRSYIVRIDKITSKSKDELKIEDITLPVSQSYLKNLQNIHF